VANWIKATWPEAGQVKMRLFDGSLVSVFKYQPEGTMNNPKKIFILLAIFIPGWRSLEEHQNIIRLGVNLFFLKMGKEPFLSGL
jgi:hypothetical protein